MPFLHGLKLELLLLFDHKSCRPQLTCVSYAEPVRVEVTEVDWIFDTEMVSSGSAVVNNRLLAGRMVFLVSLMEMLVYRLGLSSNTEN